MEDNKLKPLILVVEDNPELLKFIKISLEYHQYRVVTARNGTECLRVISSMSEVPDLIISDIMMPSMNGYELFESLSNDPRFYHIPFIFLSALASPEDIRFGKTIGVDDYLTKPFEQEDLIASISGKIKRNKTNLLISQKIENILKTYDQELYTPISHEEKKKILFIEVVWDDAVGPKLKRRFPEHTEFKFGIDKVGEQIFESANSIYGHDCSFVDNPEGILLNLGNFNIMSYAYFDAVHDDTYRGGEKLYMLAIIAPKITYFQSLQIKEILQELSNQIKIQLEWNIESAWNKITDLLVEPIS